MLEPNVQFFGASDSKRLQKIADRDFTYPQSCTENNGFVTTTKLGTTNELLLLQPKILLQQSLMRW